MISINIWIVEDDTVFRRTLQRLVSREKGMTCNRVFPSCIELFEAIETDAHPDMVLMDLGLPGMGGIEGIQKLATVAPDIAVMVLTVSREKGKVLQAIEAGAAGYLLKTATGQEIVNGLKQVFMGGVPLSPAVAKVVLEELRKSAPTEDFDLSAREIEVLKQLAKGLAVKEIAAELDIGRRTVAFHLENIYRKLQVQSQSGAVAKALRASII